MALSPEFNGWRDVMDWDAANWSRAVTFWEQHTAKALDGARVLELGAHNGGLSLLAASRGAEVVCSDLETPQHRAAPLHAAYGHQDRISYLPIDATAIDFPDATFDVVMFKSVLGGIGDWSDPQRRMMTEIARVLKPGGEVWFAENLRGSRLHMLMRHKVLKRAWNYATVDQITDVCGCFERVQTQRYGVLAAFGLRPSVQNVLAKVDAVFDPIAPQGWKYILFGVATRSQ